MVDEQVQDLQMSGTAEGLVMFLDWASRTGEIAPNTAASYKSAVTKVMEIDEAWGASKIKEVDVARQLDRFSRLRGSRYNATSLRTYGNRFSAAISHYLKYLENPSGFRAGQTKGARFKGSEKPSAGPKDSVQVGPTRNTSRGFTNTQEPGDLVQYPFPLRLGVMAYLSLPRDLKWSEAQRVAAFVASLAIDSPEFSDSDSGRES
jgi:hypothetical protein